MTDFILIQIPGFFVPAAILGGFSLDSVQISVQNQKIKEMF